MKHHIDKRKTAYLICCFILIFACFACAVSAEETNERVKLSAYEIVKGLYNPNANPDELREKSVFIREGLDDLSVVERLYLLADVYNDDTVSEYFSEKMEEGIVTGAGIDRNGYYFIMLRKSEEDKIPEIIAEFDALTEKYGTLPVAVQLGEIEVSIHMTIHNFVTSPLDAMWIVRPEYLGYLPSMPEEMEDTIRYTLYPCVLIILTLLSVSGFILFTRRKNPEEKSDSTPAKILSYLNHYPPSSQSKLTRELDISRGSVRYQLHRLSKEGKIFSKEIGGRTFYSVSPVTTDEKIQSFIQVFDDEIDWKICNILFDGGELSRQEISEKTKLSPDTVYYHLTHMGEMVIRKRVESGTAFYQLTDEMREWSEKYNLLHMINSVNSSPIQNPS